MKEALSSLGLAVVLILALLGQMKYKQKHSQKQPIISPPIQIPVLPPTPPTPPKPEPPKPDSIQKQLISAHNQIRKQNGKSLLQEDPKLMEIAQKWADHMASTGRMYHQALRFGSGFMGMGENIAMGQPTVEQVMNSWMTSRGHRNNILGNYSHIGVGIAKGNRGIFWCVDFGKKNGVFSTKIFIETSEEPGRFYASSIHN